MPGVEEFHQGLFFGRKPAARFGKDSLEDRLAVMHEEALLRAEGEGGKAVAGEDPFQGLDRKSVV